MSREALESRTKSKIEYARIHLQECQGLPRWDSSAPFVRAHEESILFHAVGARDAFLQEINGAYRLPLEMHQGQFGPIRQHLSVGRSQAFDTIWNLSEVDVDRARRTWTWLSVAVELRNQGMHRAEIARIFEVVVGGSAPPEQVYYRHPKTGDPLWRPIPEFLEEVINETEQLVTRLRPTLPG